MDEYIVEIRVYRKDRSLVDHQITDLTYMNLSGCEIEEFVEETVLEDRERFMCLEEGI